MAPGPDRAPIEGVVGFGMYPFEALVPAWDHLWEAVAARLPWLPQRLTWSTDLHEAWRSPDLVVHHTCGWPLVTELADLVRVVGAFTLDVPEAVGPTYRSVLVARRDGTAVDFAGARAAVNDDRSLSGWVSLIAAVHGPGARWDGPVVWTGAHVDSVCAVQDGRAEIASVDAVTWAHLGHLDPAAVDGLHVVGHGPRVPSLPVVVGRLVPDGDIALLRTAFQAALADVALADDREALRITGFAPLDLSHYLVLRELAPAT